MKKTSQSLAFLVLLFLCTSTGFGQINQIKKADKQYDKYSYIDAQAIYLSVVEDGYESVEIFEKLGNTYYFNSDYSNAAKWYGKLVATYPEDTKAEYYYRLAQCLKSTGNYDESDRMMTVFATLGSDDIIVKNFEANPNYLSDIAFESGAYEVEKVQINTDNSDFGTSYYMDKLVFSSASTTIIEGEVKVHEWNNQPFLDFFMADIDSEGKLSNVESLAGDINSEYHESSASFTKDGSTVYFTRNNFIDGKKGRDKNKSILLKVYKATKSGEHFWTNIMELPFNSNQYSVAHPTLSLDEKRLYFSSDMDGSLGQSDIWFVDILGDNTYGSPVNLGPSINTEARESFPFISQKNNLYYSTDGRAGLGGLDVFYTVLDENGLPTEIKNLGEPVNSTKDDFGFIIKEDKRIGYLSSNRGGDGFVNDDIYRIQEKCEITLNGVVVDKISGEIIPGALVILMDSKNKVIKKLTVGDDAVFTFMVDCELQYSVRATKDNYTPDEKSFVTPKETSSLKLKMELEIIDPCPVNDLGCKLNLQPIYFDLDRYNIRKDAATELAKILGAMKKYPELVIHIESHTDSRATHRYNEILSDRRAASTLSWLVDHGIDASRLSSKGYGETRLVNKCSDDVDCTEVEHQLNRRSMFIIQD